jgi:hypothetical protein
MNRMTSYGLRVGVFAGALCSLVAGSVVAQAQPPGPAASSAAPPPSGSAAATVPAAAPSAPAPTAEPVDAPVEPGSQAPASPAEEQELEREAEATAAAIKKAEEQAEADALAEEMLSSGGDEDIDAYDLNFYGFVDFLYSYNVKDYGFFNPYSTFAVGRFNLYTAAELGDNWRTLLETRFTYLPDGATPVQTDFSAPAARISTAVNDYTDIERPIRWGGVIIERAWLEKTYESWLNIRMGHWLTPYGIWNVDHGSPVIIGVRRPYIVGEELFPQSQTGIELHGSYGLGSTMLGYHLTLSNGRGPIDRYKDLDSNKAIGGRIYASNDSETLGVITLGMSGYLGSYTDRTDVFVFNPDGTLGVDRPASVQYDESSVAADLKWTKGGFLLQSEAIINDVSYQDGIRPFIPAGFTPVPAYTPDTRALGFYGLTGYRFDFLGTMPWVGWEYYDNGFALGGKAAAFFGGFNFRPTPRVVLKAQYTYSYFPGDNPFFEDMHFNNLDFQAAWSF